MDAILQKVVFLNKKSGIFFLFHQNYLFYMPIKLVYNSFYGIFFCYFCHFFTLWKRWHKIYFSLLIFSARHHYFIKNTCKNAQLPLLVIYLIFHRPSILLKGILPRQFISNLLISLSFNHRQIEIFCSK